MIKKLFSLFAIATLASFAYANEEVTNAPVILEEVSEVVKGDLLAAEEALLEDEAILIDEQKTELADCGCGCGPKKKDKNDNDGELLAGCKSCKRKKKQESEPAPVEAPKELLADNTTQAAEEILVAEEAAEKFATCCPATNAPEVVEEILVAEEAAEKFAACPTCPASETQETIPATEEIIEEAKLA